MSERVRGGTIEGASFSITAGNYTAANLRSITQAGSVATLQPASHGLRRGRVSA